MSNTRRSDLRDPKYGTVHELCSKLGYAGDRKENARSTFHLSSKVTKYRKDSVKDIGRGQFPLECDDEYAQLCASLFLSKNTHLFPDSRQAEIFNWPVYPRDQVKLEENLAKLMCTQEHYQRRNDEAKRTRQAREASDDDSTLEAAGEESEDAGHSHSRASSFESGHDERKTLTAEKIRENIDIHLPFIYPLDGSEERTPAFRIFSFERWPKDAKRFCWRYFHEHNLYSSRRENNVAVTRFAQTLKRHLGIHCSPAEDVLIEKRCIRQITSGPGVWRGYGFLEKVDGVLRKTAAFEAAWKLRRQQWIAEVHHGDLTHIIELVDLHLPTVPEKGSGIGSKRSHDFAQPANDLPHNDTFTGSASKRPRVNNVSEETPNGSRPAGHSDRSSRADNSPVGIIPDEAVVGEPGHIPEAIMITPVRSPPQSNPTSARFEPDHNVNNARPASSSARSSSHTIFTRPQSSSPSLQSESCPDSSSVALDDGPDTMPQEEKRSSPYALSGSSLALVKMPPPDKPSKPKSLFYILPNSRGVLDYDNPLPRETWWEYSLSQFFNLVASRAGRPDASLECLTFTYNWAPQEPFVVRRLGGDQYWEEIRERVKATFLKTRNATKKIKKFELWVECGDRTNLDEVEEDEDDC